MSVDRSLTVRILSRKPFSDLWIDFVNNYWTNKNEARISSLAKEDIEDFDFINYPDFESLKPVLDYRESKGYPNVFTFIVDQLEESMMIINKKLEHNYDVDINHYELSFNPGIGKRLERANRYTDYGFYLAQIIPRLESLGCGIAEIKCKDFDF